MYWNPPKNEHIVYEALSAIADGRIISSDDKKSAKCTSPSKGKFYTITYEPETKSIMSNDNMAYYVNEVSYPMVALLLLREDIKYDETILEDLKSIYWKDINQRFKNNYMKSVEYVLSNLKTKGKDTEKIVKEVKNIFAQVLDFKLNILGEKQIPPNAY